MNGKENHEKFLEDIREYKKKIAILQNEMNDKIYARNAGEYLYLEKTVSGYMLYGPSIENGYNLTTGNIVEICRICKINRKTLKTYCTKNFKPEIYTYDKGERIYFKTEEDGNKAIEWMQARMLIQQLKSK